MLELCGVRAGYDGIGVLHGVDMHVDEGEIIALIDSDGTGKTTTMHTIRGIFSSSHSEITYRDEAIHSKVFHEIVRRGTVQAPENRDLFTNMIVIDNLLLGAQIEEARAHREGNPDEILGPFPRLAGRKNQHAGTISGGGQQMLTLAHALMGEPDLLTLDKLSIGLASHLVQEVFDVIEDIHTQGTVVLMVKQNVQQTLKLADRGYVMENGRISITANGDQPLEDEGVVEAHFGV